MSTLPSWTTWLLDELDTSDRQAADVARGLTVAQLNWKEAPHLWSVGQCLQHLIQANEVYLPPIAEALNDRPSNPVQKITPGWLGRWFIRNYIEPDTQRRGARAPGKIVPAPLVDADVLDRFTHSNIAARDVIRRASAYDVNRIRFRNPFVPLLRFSIGTGLVVIGRHQRRHLLQAERIRQTAGFPQR